MSSRAPVLLGVVLGLAFLTQLAVQAWSRTPAYDEAVYRGISRNILRTGLPIRDSAPRSLFANSPPLALYANAGLMVLTDDHLPATRLASALIWGTLLLMIVVPLARRCLDPGREMSVIAFLCLMPLLGPEMIHVEVDLPLIVLSAALVLAWVRWAEGFGSGSRLRDAIVVGLFLALAGLVKYSALLFGPMLAVDALLLARRRGVSLTRAFRDVTVFAAIPVIALVAWYVLVRAGGVDLLATFTDLFARVKGKPEAGEKVGLLWYATVSGLGLNAFVVLIAACGAAVVVVRRSDPTRGAGMRVMAAAALHLIFFALISSAERKLRYQDPALPFLAILAAVPLRHLAWRWSHEFAVLLLGAAAGFSFHVFRDAIPTPGGLGLAVPIGLMTGLGVWTVATTVLGRRDRATSLPWVPVLALALALAVIRNPLVTGSRLEGHDFARDAGLRVAAATPPDAVIAVSDPSLAYDADRPTLLLAGGRDHREILRSGVAALIVTEDWLRAAPHLTEVLDARYDLVPTDSAAPVRLFLLRD